jgi:hypothetical protein
MKKVMAFAKRGNEKRWVARDETAVRMARPLYIIVNFDALNKGKDHANRVKTNRSKHNKPLDYVLQFFRITASIKLPAVVVGFSPASREDFDLHRSRYCPSR